MTTNQHEKYKHGNQFESVVMIHLNAAVNLARWIVKDASGAEDVVQEACLRAFRYFNRFRGGDARPWFLGIVRNCAYTWLTERGALSHADTDDEGAEGVTENSQTPAGPEDLLMQKMAVARIDAAIAVLPLAYREVIVLRALEELSYDTIANIAGVPIGTVMSRLSRARMMLRQALSEAHINAQKAQTEK